MTGDSYAYEDKPTVYGDGESTRMHTVFSYFALQKQTTTNSHPQFILQQIKTNEKRSCLSRNVIYHIDTSPHSDY